MENNQFNFSYSAICNNIKLLYNFDPYIEL